MTRPIDDDTAEAMRNGRVDLIIGVRMSAPPDAVAVRLFDDEFTCAVRRDHPKVGKRLTLERFVELPHLLIAPRGDPGSAVDNQLAKRGLSRRVVVRTHSFLAAPAIVTESDLLVTGPLRVLGPLAKPFGLRLLVPPIDIPGFTVHAAWHPRVQQDPAHAWFRRMLVESVHKSARDPLPRRRPSGSRTAS